jgi:hypothetical protein
MLLYKSSRALFAAGESASLPVKRIRLTGSAAIAAVAFLAMWQATPTAALEEAAKETRPVSRHQVRALLENSRRIETQIMDLSACAEMAGSLVACQEAIGATRTTAGQMRRLIEELDQGPGAHR